MNAFDVGVIDGIKLAAKRREPTMTDAQADKAMRYGLTGVVGGTAANTLLYHTMRPSKMRWSDEDAQRMMRHMKIKDVEINAKSGLRANQSFMHVHQGSNRPYVHVPAHHGPELLAHELGHVRRKGRSFGHATISNIASRKILPTAGAIGGAAMALKGKSGSWTTRLAPAVALASHLPTLHEEGRASLRGYRALKALGTLSKPELRTARRKLLHAFGTYGTNALAMTAPAAAIAAAKWRKKERDR